MIEVFFKSCAVKTDKIIIYFSEKHSGSVFKVKQYKNVFLDVMTLRTDPMRSSETFVNYPLVETALRSCESSQKLLGESQISLAVFHFNNQNSE
jgi:hypothetical protein